MFKPKVLTGVLALTFVIGCSETSPVERSDTGDLDSFAKQILNELQPRSIAARSEFCGLILREPDGTLRATRPTKGGTDFCDLLVPPGNIVASYHTHGSFGEEYDSEVPSPDDLQSDFEFQTDGYISTPGGRLWRVDHKARIARQICGQGCLAADPNYDPTDSRPVAQSYTLRELRLRFFES